MEMKARLQNSLNRISEAIEEARNIFSPMAKEEDRIEQGKQKLLRATKLEVIVKESLISPSQEEILQQISPCKHQPSPNLSPSSSSQLSSRDFYTVGTHHTTFYSPQQTQEEEEEKEESFFDPKFESDRDQSQSQSQFLNTQCLDIPKPFAIFNSPIQTPPKSKSQKPLPLQSSPASTNSKFCNPTPPQNTAMLKPPSCCRRLIGFSEEVTKSAKSPPDLGAAETLKNTHQLLDSQGFNQFNTQDFHNLSQIETSDLGGKLAEVGEKRRGQSWGEEIRARRILPPFFSTSQREISAPSCLEKASSAPKFLEKEICGPTSLDPKRQHRVAAAKPYPKSLMDVIMNCSGEPPEGYEDVDVLEAAINAGITFPPPLSRHSFCK